MGGCRNQGNPGLPCPCTRLSACCPTVLCQAVDTQSGLKNPSGRSLLWQGGNPTPRPLQLPASPPHLTFSKRGQFRTSRRAKTVLYRSGFAPKSHCATRWISQACKMLGAHLMYFLTYRGISVVKAIPRSPHTLCPPSVLPNACASSTAGPTAVPAPSAALYAHTQRTIQHRI